MIKIGMIDIDTTHPDSCAKALMGNDQMKITAVCNTGFRTQEEVGCFREKYQIDHQANSIEELADLTDIGFIGNCNWDKHIEHALPFINRNKIVFIDKPAVGNIKDCFRLEELEKKGATITGGSTLRYEPRLQETIKQLNENPKDKVVSIYASVGGGGDFYYGIHMIEVINEILGNGIESIQFISQNQNSVIYSFQHINGAHGVLLFGSNFKIPFNLTLSTMQNTIQMDFNVEAAEKNMFTVLKSSFENKRFNVNGFSLSECTKIIIAAEKSKESGGKKIMLESLEEGEPFCFNGYEFEKEYIKVQKDRNIYRI
jgi:predicted dehydrogenase